MTGRVDRLFGGKPVGESQVRRATILLAIAVPLDVLGLVTCTSVPGALLTLAAWQLAEADMKRIEAGELSVEHAPAIARVKQIAFWAMGACILGFGLQLVPLSTGTYERWLRAL